jgi:hypothetical protein
MINFRFHLVSLIAVFLALGLGILVGSTVIDQGIVNRLDSEINSVRKENSAREATSKQLSQQNSRLQQFIDRSAGYVGDGRLGNHSVAVVAERGVDGGVVKRAEQALQAAGAEVPGVLWLDDAWKLDSDSKVQALQAALGLAGTASTTRDAALDLLVRRLAKAPSKAVSTTTTREPTGSALDESTTSRPRQTSTTLRPTAAPIDAITALDKAGFLTVTDGNPGAFATFPSHAVEVLVVTGDDSDFAGGDLTPTFVRAVVNAGLPTVVGAVYDGGGDQPPERGASLGPILNDQNLSSAVSTVDDLELVQGQVAAVLSLGIVGSGTVGHYGYGTGASTPLPPHPS